MSFLNVFYLCIALLIGPCYTNSFPDVPSNYVTEKCKEVAKTFVVPKVPLAFDSALFCMFQNLEVLQDLRSLRLALTTPHTGRSICEIEVHSFNNKTEQFNMTISDTDLKGNCTPRNGTVIVQAVQDHRTGQLSVIKMPRKIGMSRISFKNESARLLFTDYRTCLILITDFFYGTVKYCELFVMRNDSINMHSTQCHSIYRIYCGYGRPTRDEWPNPAKYSSDYQFLVELHSLRLLVEHKDPLKEDTVFMNEFQVIPEVLYRIPEANVYATTYNKTVPRLCGIQTYKITPDLAELELKMITSGGNKSMEGVRKFRSDMNAISPTQIYLPDQYGLQRVLLSNFNDCYVLKKVGNSNNWPPFCEFFVKNNTNPTTDLDECWFVFFAYCGYPKAFYKETSCYS
uniref:Salivary lipocalin n=1 Tax=Ixodes ricinus TaxID=34613 RepID=A0A147BXB1_IXORI